LNHVAHPKHEQVRAWYACRCGYCGVAEDQVGGELTIDHFVPVSAGGGEAEENLVYACHRCNLYKGDFAATQEDHRRGHRAGAGWTGRERSVRGRCVNNGDH